jgi:hypothetical protein
VGILLGGTNPLRLACIASFTSVAPCRYNYQDILLTYPTYNRTCAKSAYAYAVYTGTDNYIDMQDSTYFESVASSDKRVPLPQCPSWALEPDCLRCSQPSGAYQVLCCPADTPGIPSRRPTKGRTSARCPTQALRATLTRLLRRRCHTVSNAPASLGGRWDEGST